MLAAALVTASGFAVAVTVEVFSDGGFAVAVTGTASSFGLEKIEAKEVRGVGFVAVGVVVVIGFPSGVAA